jgi:hypothetical protein
LVIDVTVLKEKRFKEKKNKKIGSSKRSEK